MDPRTIVHPVVKDDSSEEETRLSTDAPSFDDDVDSDKGSGNSKKRKRGSYRCSRCGMPKRGHNCPDTFEGVHFAIVESPPSTVTTPGAKSGNASAKISASPVQAPAQGDDSTRETLLMHLNNLREENMRLAHENQHLHEVCQYQAMTLRQLQGPHHAQPDFAHGPMVHPNAPNAPGMFPSNGPALPHFNHMPQFPPQLPQQNGPSASLPRPGFVNAPAHPPALPMNGHAPLPHNAGLPSHPNSQYADDESPPAKRAKLEESPSSQTPYLQSNNPSHPSLPHHNSHPYLPMTASPFLHDLPEVNRHLHGARPISVGSSQYEYDYDCNEWQDNDSSTSEYYPQFGMDAPAPLIY